jgi:single-stranded DNA-binding protein
MDEDEAVEAPKPARKKLTHLMGNLGQEPKIIDSEKVTSGEIVKLNLGVPMTNGNKDNPGDTFWCDITIFDGKMQARAKAELHTGDKIGVSGYLEWREVEGRKFAQMVAQRISHLEFWEKDPYTPRETASAPEDWVAPF